MTTTIFFPATDIRLINDALAKNDCSPALERQHLATLHLCVLDDIRYSIALHLLITVFDGTELCADLCQDGVPTSLDTNTVLAGEHLLDGGVICHVFDYLAPPEHPDCFTFRVEEDSVAGGSTGTYRQEPVEPPVLLTEKEETGTITITVQGGVVVDVTGLPDGWNYRLIDHDNDYGEDAEM